MITGFENTEVSVVSEDDKYSPSIRSIGQPAPPGFIFSFDEIRALDGQESPSMEFKNDSMFSQEHQDLFKSENTREHSLYSEDSLKNKQKVVDAIINGKQQKNDNEKSISWGSSTSEYYLQRYFQGFKDTEKHIYSVASSVRSNDIPEEMHIDPVSLGSSLDHEHFQAARRRKSGMNTPQPSQIPSAITVIKDKTPKQKGSLRGFHKEKAADAVAEEPSVQIQWELMYKKMNSIEEKLDQYNNSQSQLQKVWLELN